MRSHEPTFRELRRSGAPVMLGVFLLATLLAPLAHLATHRAGHTHGPPLATFQQSDHDAAPRHGQPHAHASEDEHADTNPYPDDPARRSGGLPDATTAARALRTSASP